MNFPALAYKEAGDTTLYGLKSEKRLKRTSRELLQSGVFENVVIIDNTGAVYKIDNVVETGWANPFWGYSLLRKGRQIIVEFDLKFLRQESFENVKTFVLNRLKSRKRDILARELVEEINKTTSIPQIIKYFT